MAQKVIHKRSSVLGKTPTTEQADYGELIINYASGTGSSFFATRKADDSFAKFHEDAYWDAVIKELSDKIDTIDETVSSATSTTYKFVMDENGIVRCVKNDTEEGFNISESGIVSLK